MFLRTFFAWNIRSSNVTSYLYFPRILGPFVCYSIDGKHLEKNSATEGTTDFKSNEINIKEKGKSKKTRENKRLALNIVEPMVDLGRRQEVKSVVGIHLGPKALYWAQIDRKGNVLEWNHANLFPTVEAGRKMHLPKMFSMMDSVSEKIPFSDIFVLETLNQVMLNSMSSPAVISAAMLHSQMIAILLTILNLRQENENNLEEYYHKVFLLKPRVVSRFFNLLVGTERVSALALVDLILGNRRNSSSSLYTSEIMNVSKADTEGTLNADVSKKQSLPIYTPIQATASVKDSYHALGAVEKEAMSQALLTAMAFYDLVVFKDPNVLAPLYQ